MEVDTPLTSTVQIFKRKSQSGFTLIEVMMVLAILAAVMTLALPRLAKKEKNVRSAVRQIAILSKEVRNRARITSSTFRIVFQIGQSPATYWVERASGLQLMDKDPDSARQKRIKELNPEAPSPWQKDTLLIKEEKSLPKGLVFGLLQTSQKKEPQEEGTAYVHFFPDGSVERTLLQITDKKDLTWSLVFHALTGQIDLVEKAKRLEDIQQ